MSNIIYKLQMTVIVILRCMILLSLYGADVDDVNSSLLYS